jgi:hypothetical protein
MKYLIPPFKWTQVGTKKNIWFANVESTRNDFERCFGILKKRFRCLINPLELQYPAHIERLFNACAVIHNILLDYDGIDNWEAYMKKQGFLLMTILYMSRLCTSKIASRWMIFCLMRPSRTYHQVMLITTCIYLNCTAVSSLTAR